MKWPEQSPATLQSASSGLRCRCQALSEGGVVTLLTCSPCGNFHQELYNKPNHVPVLQCAGPGSAIWVRFGGTAPGRQITNSVWGAQLRRYYERFASGLGFPLKQSLFIFLILMANPRGGIPEKRGLPLTLSFSFIFSVSMTNHD